MVATEIHNWEGSELVKQILIFNSDATMERFMEDYPDFPNFDAGSNIEVESGLVDCIVRAIQNPSDGKWKLVVRNGRGEQLYDVMSGSFTTPKMAIEYGTTTLGSYLQRQCKIISLSLYA